MPIPVRVLEPEPGASGVMSGLSGSSTNPSVLQAKDVTIISRSARNMAYAPSFGITETMICASGSVGSRSQLKCDGTRAETRFLLSAKRASPFKSAGASFQSTSGSRGVRINGSNAGYTMFRGSVKGTGYPLHSSVSLSLSLTCVTVYHHVSAGVYTCLPW